MYHFCKRLEMKPILTTKSYIFVDTYSPIKDNHSNNTY